MASSAVSLSSPTAPRLAAREHVARRLPTTRAVASRPARSVRLVVVSAESAGKQEVVAITGATGFVGKAVVRKLLADGAKVRVLTRSAFAARLALPDLIFNKDVSFHVHNTLTGELGWFDAVKGATGVINLAGAPISTRWNEQVKRELVGSRLNATQLVVKAINALPKAERPRAFVSSSAIGYYGTSEKAEYTESSSTGKDFLAGLCQKWESAASEAEGTRLTIVRTGVVLEKDGGALAKILPIYYTFAGGPVGSGRNWFSWIHRTDLVNLIVEAMRNPKYSGVVNGTAPAPVRFGDFCAEVAKAANRPNLLPVPGFVVRLLLGEGATVVLDGQKVLPKRALDLGFKFQFSSVDQALAAIVNPKSATQAAPAPAAAVPKPAQAKAAAAAAEAAEAAEAAKAEAETKEQGAQQWKAAADDASAARFAEEIKVAEAAAAEAEERFLMKAAADAEAKKAAAESAAAKSTSS